MQEKIQNIAADFLRRAVSHFRKLTDYKYTPLIIAASYIVVMLFIGLTFHSIGSYRVVSENDLFSSYIPHAKEFLKGNFVIDHYRGPAYTILLACTGFIFGDFLKAGIIIAVFSAGAALFFTYGIIKKLFSKEAALAVTILTALNPIFIEYTYGAGTDMFFNAAVSAVAYFLLTKNNFKWKNIFLLGVLAAITYLTRYNASYLILLIPIIITAINIYNIKILKKISASLLFLALFFITILPWGIYTLNKKGNFFFNENYKNIALSLGETENFDWERAWHSKSEKFDSYLEIIIEKPVLLAKTSAVNFFSHLFDDLNKLIGLHIGIFSIIGIIFLFRIITTARQLSYFLINILFFLILLPIFYSERFSLFLIPFYTLLGFIGVNKFSKIYFNQKIKEITAAALILLAAINLLSAVHYNKYQIKGPEEVAKAAALFDYEIFENGNRKKIAARLPHIAYHLDLDWAKIPYSTPLNETIKKLKDNKVDYLYFSGVEWKSRTNLRSLIDPKNAPEDLKPIIYFPNKHTVIYKIIYN